MGGFILSLVCSLVISSLFLWEFSWSAGKQSKFHPTSKEEKSWDSWKECRSWPDYTTLVSCGGAVTQCFQGIWGGGACVFIRKPRTGTCTVCSSKNFFPSCVFCLQQKLVGDALYKHTSRIKINSFLFLRKISMMYEHFSSQQGQVLLYGRLLSPELRLRAEAGVW